MAGGKETPRQKMIGMMYLVLTALLALNVSKQIVAAFITLNDKLDASAQFMHHKNGGIYAGFDQKAAALKSTGSDMTEFNIWQNKASQLKSQTAGIISFLLSECNDMIKMSEGDDWIKERDDKGNITKLKPLIDIDAMDNYDIPTNLFVGGNPNDPNERGRALRDSIHAFRNTVCYLMGTYKKGQKKYEFNAPEDPVRLHEALKTANPEDTSKLVQLYRSLTVPERLLSHEDGAGELPWASVTFDHAPIVAAAAMFTSLKLDVKNAESTAAEYMLAKVEAPIFVFNKIEPLPFAGSSYINQGDSLGLRVMVAAYDSNEIARIRYGIDADTLPEKWSETSGTVYLGGRNPGQHNVKGAIGVRERGDMKWKPWEYSYTVGQPTGVVALPEMRQLYWGYPNIVEGTASGFPPDRISLSGTGCRLTAMGNGKFKVTVERGIRTASIKISGRNDDGSVVNLGSHDFVCKPMPPATVYLGRTESGGTMSLQAATHQNKVRVALDPSVPLTNANYMIISGELRVNGVPGNGTVNSGGFFDDSAKRLMRQAKNKDVTIEVKYEGPDHIRHIGLLKFKVT